MPNVSLPVPPNGPSWMAQLFMTIRTALGRCIATDEAVSSFRLKSANGTVYIVTVSNSGTITTTAA